MPGWAIFVVWVLAAVLIGVRVGKFLNSLNARETRALDDLHSKQEKEKHAPPPA
jgi:hypothetical protein